MPDRHSIAEARRNLTPLIREAENGKTVELPRRGFIEAYRHFTNDFDLAELALDPDKLFKDVRKETPGRDIQL